jgi:hypothetical protein
MATMYEKMMERLVDRVADQAVEIAKLIGERDDAVAQKHDWERRALAAEKRLADSVNWQESSERNYQAFQVQKNVADKATALLERVERYHDGLFAHTPETGSLLLEICEFLRPGSAPEWFTQREEEEVANVG